MTNSQSPNLVRSLHSQRHVKMPKISNTELYPKHLQYFREEDATAAPIKVPSGVNIISLPFMFLIFPQKDLKAKDIYVCKFLK